MCFVSVFSRFGIIISHFQPSHLVKNTGVKPLISKHFLIINHFNHFRLEMG
jgi:hypothetical protein